MQNMLQTCACQSQSTHIKDAMYNEHSLQGSYQWPLQTSKSMTPTRKEKGIMISMTMYHLLEIDIGTMRE
jgi:hypothetical protein